MTDNIEIHVTTTPVVVEISNAVRPQNLFVGPYTDSQIAAMQLSAAGLVIQTGLGPDGTGIDLWIEDGT